MDHDIRPRRWPWLVAIVVTALGVLGIVHYRRGAKDAADLVKDFLGRPYNFKAFEKFLSE
ncbi:MAG: hypothetical protein ABJE66_03140 [Deltaproteobacteria bacterium]